VKTQEDSDATEGRRRGDGNLPRLQDMSRLWWSVEPSRRIEDGEQTSSLQPSLARWGKSSHLYAFSFGKMAHPRGRPSFLSF